MAAVLATQLGRGGRETQLSLSRALIALGEVIMPALRAAMTDPDPRVRAARDRHANGCCATRTPDSSSRSRRRSASWPSARPARRDDEAVLIGDVARRSGVSARMLRHYDSLGLVRPTGRTGAGYREYSSEDIRRIFHIESLRSLGLSLREVGRALDDPGFTPSELVDDLIRPDARTHRGRDGAAHPAPPDRRRGTRRLGGRPADRRTPAGAGVGERRQAPARGPVLGRTRFRCRWRHWSRRR